MIVTSTNSFLILTHTCFNVLKHFEDQIWKWTVHPSNFITVRYHGSRKTSSTTLCSSYFSGLYLVCGEVVANISINAEWVNWPSKIGSGRCKYYFWKEKLCISYIKWLQLALEEEMTEVLVINISGRCLILYDIQ